MYLWLYLCICHNKYIYTALSKNVCLRFHYLLKVHYFFTLVNGLELWVRLGLCKFRFWLTNCNSWQIIPKTVASPESWLIWHASSNRPIEFYCVVRNQNLKWYLITFFSLEPARQSSPLEVLMKCEAQWRSLMKICHMETNDWPEIRVVDWTMSREK